MYNKVILIGNLTKDPELRYTPQGTPVCSLRLACSTKYKSSDSMKEETLFIDVVVWGKQGESCGQYLNKGSSALVEGRLQERRWESDGQQRSKFEVVAQTVRFLSAKKSASQGGGGGEDLAPPEETTDLEPF
ncbi:MAG TPA: single-stranded DNA-binding protein [Candidatus Sulfobium mesophilum]|jgi:single-strand DNA-binding protein|nr:single-stranded DNA-binding protein [Candidatus Sulfobium mesophilum]